VEYAHLLVTAGRPEDALAVLENRRFQPWEGGEGRALRAWERTRLALADHALARGNAEAAIAHVQAALNSPESLGEARHPLANPARLLLTLGIALDAAGTHDKAERCWREAAALRGDFTEMSPSAFSENTYFSILAARRLGESAYADELVAGLTRHAEQLHRTPADIDYFATSLPSLLFFDDDPQRRLDIAVEVLRAQLALLADDPITARCHLDAVLAANPGHEVARDLTDQLQLAQSLP
jgi:tetratricopeptide (TPR) repeat protein